MVHWWLPNHRRNTVAKSLVEWTYDNYAQKHELVHNVGYYYGKISDPYNDVEIHSNDLALFHDHEGHTVGIEVLGFVPNPKFDMVAIQVTARKDTKYQLHDVFVVPTWYLSPRK